MTLFGIFGAGGCGRGILPLVRAALTPGAEAVFVDDADLGRRINGARRLTFDEFAGADDRAICLAVANGAVREKLAQRCADAGLPFFSAIAKQHILMDQVAIGEGALISPYTTLTSNIRVGRHFHLNHYSYVEHDCIIGDFVTFAPGVKCNGNIHIEDHAYIGTGAVLRQGTPSKPLRIGRGATVGMGAVVTKDVPAGEVWAGNPARPLRR